MYYSQPLSFSIEENLLTAWESCVRDAPRFADDTEVFSRFAAAYAKIEIMPRGARRALQRKLARSNDLVISVRARRHLAASIAAAARSVAKYAGGDD
jgi:hypothetical protein